MWLTWFSELVVRSCLNLEIKLIDEIKLNLESHACNPVLVHMTHVRQYVTWLQAM